MIIIKNNRLMHGLILLSTMTAMAIAYFFEYKLGLNPCPLCITQRLVVILIGLNSLFAFLHQPEHSGRKFYAGSLLCFALMGVGLAARQLYLQSLPLDQVPTCMPDVGYLIDVLPFQELISVMFNGTGDCAEVKWTFLGGSIAFWTFCMFIGYLILAAFSLSGMKRPSSDSIKKASV